MCFVLLAALAQAAIDPGKIGLEFFGNEFAVTQKIKNFPTMEFSLTLRIKASSGNILNYGVQSAAGQFDPGHFSLTNAKSLAITRGGQTWETATNFADNQWHSMAITWKMATGELKLYKDGNLVSSTQSGKGSPMAVDGFMMLGQIQNCPMACFTAKTGFVGTLADVTLWKRALTPNQVQYLSANSPKGDETDLVSYWPLNENDGTVGRDTTPSANNFLAGGPRWIDDAAVSASPKSLSMRKNGAVLVTPNNDLPTGDFTVEFWMKTAIKEDSTIVAYYDPTSATKPYPLRIHNPGLITVDINGEQVRSDTSAATGAWNHVAVSWTKAKGRVRVYLNGALSFPPQWLPESDYDMMPAVGMGAVLPARPARLVIGNLVQCTAGSCLVTGAGLDAAIQDLRIWNVVRSGSDIAQWKDLLLPTDPVPDGLLVNLVLNQKEGETLATDTSGRGNNGVLTVPIWKNTLIAPPFPNLDNLNQKVAQLREQMIDLMDYVKEVMEPAAPKAVKSFSVTEQSKCDRRYKYLCTTKVQSTAPPVVVTSPKASAANSNAAAFANVNVLVQRALSHHRGEDIDLSEDLEPRHESHHHHVPLPEISDEAAANPAALFHHVTEDASNELLELDSNNAVDREDDAGDEADSRLEEPESSRVSTVIPGVTPIQPSNSASGRVSERVRHAWAVKKDAPAAVASQNVRVMSSVPTTASTPAAVVTEHSSNVRVGTPVKTIHASHVTAGAEGVHRRHAWATGINEKIVRSGKIDSAAEFLEEEATIKPVAAAIGERDDDAPEQLARVVKRHPMPERSRSDLRLKEWDDSEVTKIRGEDFDSLQRQFEKEQQEFEHFGELPDEDAMQDEKDAAKIVPDAGDPVEEAEDAIMHGAVNALQEDAGILEPSSKGPVAAAAVPKVEEPVATEASGNAVEEVPSASGKAVEHHGRQPHEHLPPHHSPHHQHSHHHHRHHHSRHSAKGDDESDNETREPELTEEKPKVAAIPAPAPAPAPRPVNKRPVAVPAPSVRRASKTMAFSAVRTVGEGVGGRVEQLALPGKDSEWDEAIAQGVSSSELGDSDIRV